jgi:DNA-directed RNA polymerase I subunit RPA43
MANQMLSVIGSIQPDPFSPEHVPKKAAPVSPESEEADEVLNQLLTGPAAEDDLGEDSDEENDTFRRLGKMADEAKRAELKARQEAEAAAAAAKAAKKKKKKEKEKKPSAGETITRETKTKKARRKKVE